MRYERIVTHSEYIFRHERSVSALEQRIALCKATNNKHPAFPDTSLADSGTAEYTNDV